MSFIIRTQLGLHFSAFILAAASLAFPLQATKPAKPASLLRTFGAAASAFVSAMYSTDRCEDATEETGAQPYVGVIEDTETVIRAGSIQEKRVTWRADVLQPQREQVLRKSPLMKGVRKYRDGRYCEALLCFEGASQSKNMCFAASAICNVGHMLFRGHGTDREPEKAFILFKTAADLGHAGAIHMLGVCLRDGVGCEKNIPRAKVELERAANSGHKGAQTLSNQMQ